MQAQAILFTDINQVTLADVEIPEPGVGELLLEALYTVISPGTELRCLAGKQADAVFPYIAGYAFVGRLITAGASITIKKGTLAYCAGTTKANVTRLWGGHCSHVVQPEAFVVPLPDNLDPVWGAAAHMAAIAYRGVRLSQPKAHETKQSISNHDHTPATPFWFGR